MEHRERMDRVFFGALELDPSERSVFVDRACGDDAALRAEVSSLLAADATSGRFLSSADLDLSPLLSERDDPVVGSLVGAYRIVRRLGSGGMGSVYLAERDDRMFEKRVAVKLIRPGLGTEGILDRFHHERRVLAGLQHENIAILHDGGATEDGRPFLVMEHVDGLPIDQYARERSLSLPQVLELFRIVCSAVAHAHRKLVVHRDLKPGNILVTAEGVVKLLDFGIAKVLEPGVEDHGVTLTEERRLTPGYASPEHVIGESITTASDIYSLGVVLYELLTGRHPHDLRGKTLLEVARIISQEDPAPPSSIGSSPLSGRLDGDLDTIVAKAMHKDPERRYADAERLSEDIGRYLRGHPVLARPDTTRYRLSKFVQRNRMGVGLAGVFVFCFGCALVVITWLFLQARTARDEAERRTEDTRRLAGEMLFEVYGEVERLSGATKARQRLVDTGLAALDRLALDSGSDPAALAELARGYQRLGDVLSLPNEAHLGQSAEGLASYQRGLALAERAAQAEPEIRDLALLPCEFLSRIGEMQERLGSLSDAVASFQRSIEIARRHSSADHLRRSLKGLGEAQHKLGRSELATAALEEAIQIGREQAHADPALFSAPNPSLHALAQIHLRARRLGKADSLAREALAISDSLAGIHPEDARLQLDLAQDRGLLGRVRLAAGQEKEAESLLLGELDVLERLAEEDAHDVNIRRKLSMAHEHIGGLHYAAGDFEKALTSYRMALAADSVVAAIDTTSVEARGNLAVCYISVSDAALMLERHDLAAGATRRALELLEPLVAQDPHDLDLARRTAVSNLRLGELTLADGKPHEALPQFERAAIEFEKLAGYDPEDGWTSRMVMVAHYFVAWSHRELGHDSTEAVKERARHLGRARDGFRQTLEMCRELDARQMLLEPDRGMLPVLEAEIEGCGKLMDELAAR